MAARVTPDAIVRSGRQGRGGVQRVVLLERPGMAEPVVLVTSEAPDPLSALKVLALYRHRWGVEIFFRTRGHPPKFIPTGPISQSVGPNM